MSLHKGVNQSMQPAQYDLIVIGGGSGGLASAKRAAEYGARVLLIEAERLGGTCVNTGCIPKKMLWYTSDLAHKLRDAAEYGFSVRAGRCDWDELRLRRQAYIARLNRLYEDSLHSREVQFVAGWASFVDTHTVKVNDAYYRAPHILIATGTRPTRPDLPGAELGITSDDFFDLPVQPERAALIGSGYIAVELACLLQALGTQVCLVIRHNAVLRNFEPFLGEALLNRMQLDGIEIHKKAIVSRLTGQDGASTITLQDGRVLAPFDCVLWAAGRLADHARLNLAAAEVQCDAKGYIEVDAFQNTTTPGIYALGDVCGHAPLTPVAIAAGRRLAERLFDSHPDCHLDYENIPTVIFTHPPIATVGLTQAQAMARYGREQVRVYESNFVPLYHALTIDKPRTQIQLITAGPEQKVVGLHMIGEQVDEILQGFAVAIRMGATKQDFDDTIAIHPTSAEEIVTLR